MSISRPQASGMRAPRVSFQVWLVGFISSIGEGPLYATDRGASAAFTAATRPRLGPSIPPVFYTRQMSRVPARLEAADARRVERDIVEPERHGLPRVGLPAEREVGERRPPVGLAQPLLVDVGRGRGVQVQAGDLDAVDPALHQAGATIDHEFDAQPLLRRQRFALLYARGAERGHRRVVRFA